MKVRAAAIPEVKEVKPPRRFDPRGFFPEIFREDLLRQHGIASRFVQENLSLSADRGVVRGLHFQIPPQAQAKLVRVAAGSIFDVAVDMRHGSPTYGHHGGVMLSAAEGNQLFLPEGLAHASGTPRAHT